MKKLAMALCVVGPASIASGQAMVDNPEYEAWAAFHRGLMVKTEKVSLAKIKGQEQTIKTTLAPDGLLRWAVPQSFLDPDSTVIIRVSAASEQETFHTSKIAVGPQPGPGNRGT